MNTLKKLTLALATTTLIFSACKEDNIEPTKPKDNNAQELITTVILSGFNANNPSANQFSVKWEDIDGDGGDIPKIDTLTLDSGITYRVQVLMLDKTKTPFDTISKEVVREANEHQMFYTFSANLNDKLNIARLDTDSNNPPLPLGLDTRITPSNVLPFGIPLIGSLNIKLSHYDGVPKTTTPSSESDIDINLPVKLK
jgi:hypothetical protein